MSFTNLIFPFVWLPISLLLYYILPKKGRNAALLICSILFFAWGTPEYLLLMLCSILVNYLAALELSAYQKKGQTGRARLVLTVTVLLNLLLLGFFKYYGFLLRTLNTLLSLNLRARELPLPIGLSFYTFTLLSYLFDVYRGKAPVQKNLLRFSLYVTFFPKLVSGPIVQYADFDRQVEPHMLDLTALGAGARMFVVGMAKKVLLSNALGTTFYALSDIGGVNLSTCGAWLGTLCYTLMLYFDFSGYSDMAIGVSQMFGFELAPNFHYPYCASSITEFWRRWHISLGAWFRDYVYIPLGGSRAGSGRTIRNLLVVWLLTGLWHGASWSFVVWGLYYGLLLILEKFVFQELLTHIPRVLRHILTLFLVMVGWVFFFSGTIGDAACWLGRMFFGGHVGFLDATAKYYFSQCWPLLLIGGVAAFPAGKLAGQYCYRRGQLLAALSALWFVLLFVLSVAGMTNATYSTFLYFQF